MKDDDKVILLISAIFSLFVYALIIFLLWNCLVPKIFSLPEINYWDAVGLKLLANALFHRTEIDD